MQMITKSEKFARAIFIIVQKESKKATDLNLPQILVIFNQNYLKILLMSKYPPFWKGYYCDEDQEENIVVFHLQFTSFEIYNEDNKTKIHAQGKDQDGNIAIDGDVYNQKEIDCTYASPKRKLIFRGTIQEDGLIEGDWGPDPENMGRGNFKLQRISITPGWNGYYVQSDIHHHMKFEKLIIEAVPNGKVIGHGSDEVGDFQINGTFSTANNEVSFSKRYTSGDNKGEEWDYWGTLNNQQITGSWGFQKGEQQGQFKLTYYE